MKRIRTFIAVDLGKSIRDRLITLQETLARAGTEVKWVERDNLHLTLLFLGEVDDREVIQVCRIVQQCTEARSAFPIGVETAGGFPNGRRPRVLWVGIGPGADSLVELHDALEEPLQDLGYRREARRYTPHVTLGRVKSNSSTEDLSAALVKRAGWKAGETVVREVLVMSSQHSSQGPTYTVLSRCKMKQEDL